MLLPEIPTVDQFVPGFEAGQWVGIGAPKNTPVEIVERLNREINAGLADATLKARIADLGGVPLPGSPADFGKFVAAETKKWGDVINVRKNQTGIRISVGAWQWMPARRDRQCAAPNCGSSNVTNRTEHVVLISAQIGRTLGRSVAFRGMYDDGPRSDCALPHFACALPIHTTLSSLCESTPRDARLAATE